MRRLAFLALAVFLVACIPIIASGDTAMAANFKAATIIATTNLDANIGAPGPGTAMLNAYNDKGATMPAGTSYNVPITICCLRAKGSGHDAGVSLGSASALTYSSVVDLNLDATSGSTGTTASSVATAGASGTCTWHPLRC